MRILFCKIPYMKYYKGKNNDAPYGKLSLYGNKELFNFYPRTANGKNTVTEMHVAEV